MVKTLLLTDFLGGFLGGFMLRYRKCFPVAMMLVLLCGCGGGGGSSSGNGTNSGIPGSNAAPIANAGNTQSVYTNATVVLDASQSTDANADILTYQWTLGSKPVGSTAALSSATSVKPTFVADIAGAYTFSLVVNDGKVNSNNTATVTITAGIQNLVPIANAGVAQNVSTGAVVSLSGISSTDSNGDTLTYAWTLTSTPLGSNAVLGNATTATPSFIADKAGNYIASLVVNDGKVNSVAATITITASTANVAPVSNAGSAQIVSSGTTVILDGTASLDANGDVLTYTWSLSTKPVNSTASLSSIGASKPAFVADKAGVYVAQLIVFDGIVASTPSTVTITATLPAPATPSGLALVSDSGSSAADGITRLGNIRWVADINATSYNVYNGTALMGNVPSPAYTITGDGTYAIKIAGVNSSGTEGPRSSELVVVLDTTVPTATYDSTATPYNTAKSAIDVLVNDSDVNGVSLTGVLIGQDGGTFTVNAGKIDFAPAGNFTGTASVTYEVKDAAGNKSTTTLLVDVHHQTANYIQQGGLTWMPNMLSGLSLYGLATWASANNFCLTTAINGQTGWRLPTKNELLGLYSSGQLAGKQNWALNYTWSASLAAANSHYIVSLSTGVAEGGTDSGYGYVTCVR